MSNVATVKEQGELLPFEPYIGVELGDDNKSFAQQIARMFADVCEHIAIPLTYQPEEVEIRFQELARSWRFETRFQSSVTEIVTNPSYQEIIGLGPPAIPLIMMELRKGKGVQHWFWALKAITGIDPVSAEDRGRVSKMAESWLQWGREQGFVSPDETK